jgi:3-dehydroquinate synthase
LSYAILILSERSPAREIRSGAAEVIKYGAVCSAELFEQLERGDLERLLSLNPATLVDVVSQCIALKARVVEQDEFDKKGSAMSSTSVTRLATRSS